MRRVPKLWMAAGVLLAACSGPADDVASPPSSGNTSEPSRDRADSDSVDGAAQEADDGGTTDVFAAPSGGDADDELPGVVAGSRAEVPDDPAVRTGTLANGLRYYVRFNDNPGAKAEMRLAIRAGSVNEIGPSTGVAHFAEHMLFNGTELFPENELINVLRSFGAAFGADINAYTSFDETVYTLTVPNADESVALGLSVLEQWLSHATFDAEQVVAERGVVLDEWRVRTQSTSGRLFQVAEEMYLAGSAYDGRSPIGSDDSISNIGDGELREFYDGWYRPDNAAIVVVGDIDVDEMVADIGRIFGPAAPRSESAPSRPVTEFTVDTDPDYGLHLDPDQQTVDVEISLPIPASVGDGAGATLADLIDEMIYGALVRRLEQDVAAGRASFDRISRGGNSFVDTLDAPALYAFTDAGRVGDTLQALLDEYERADRFGFTADETDVSRAALQSAFDSRFDGRDSTQDREYADQYVQDFLADTGFPSIEDEYESATALLAAITPEAMDLRFRARWANSAPHVIISAPERVADRMPTESQVLDLIASLPDRPIEAREEQRELPDALMDRPQPADVANTRRVLDRGTVYFDPLELIFPNGATVIMNANPIVEGQIFVQAGSPGGSSLVADADVVDALYAAEVVTTGGVADFNQAELAQILAGRDVNVQAWISPYRDNMIGSAATADAEQLFQLVHLYLTRPRYDPVALGQLQQRVGPIVADPGSDPAAAGDDALLDTRYPAEPRYAALPEPGDFETLDLTGVERVWTDRYGDASDWVFVFSGDFDVDLVIELAASYLGPLPGSGPAETPIDVSDPPPDEVVRTTVEAGTGETASVSLLFTSPIDDIDASLRANADVVTEVITARLSDVIREELGESYSPRASTFVTTDPDPVVETFVRVTGSPDRVEAIGDLVIGELADLAADGPTDQEFSNALAQVEEAYGFVNNSQFMAELLDDAIDPARELDDFLFESIELDRVTSNTVTSYIGEHMPAGRFIQVTVLPR